MTDEPRLTDEELAALRPAAARAELDQIDASMEGEWGSPADAEAIRAIVEAAPGLVAEVRRLRTLRTEDPYQDAIYPHGGVTCFWCGANSGLPHEDDCAWANTAPEATT